MCVRVFYLVDCDTDRWLSAYMFTENIDQSKSHISSVYGIVAGNFFIGCHPDTVDSIGLLVYKL